MDLSSQISLTYPDAFRAQLYFSLIQEEVKQIQSFILNSRIYSYPNLLDDFCVYLGREIDQIILPSITFEIHDAKDKNELFGQNSKEKYVSYFVDGSLYTNRFKSFLKKYPELEMMIRGIIKQTFTSLLQALLNYEKDQNKIVQQFDEIENSKLKSIIPLLGADRHCGNVALLFCYSNKTKIVYKPSDMTSAMLFYEFNNILNLESPFNLKALKVIQGYGYGWIEFVGWKECQNYDDIHNYYRRAGTLLAIAECLHFTDGHFENLVAHADYPFIIDFETFFQNYEPPVLKSKNLLTTLLIQKINDDKEPFINSAFQAPAEDSVHYFHTHAINDQTDDLEIRYNFSSKSDQIHCPKVNGKFCPAHEHVLSILQGFCHTYERITEYIDAVLNFDSWWSILENVHSRIILRGTTTYSYLLRKIQHPELLISRTETEKYLFAKLGDTPYTSYEINQLLALNIPYFYHCPGKRHLFDSNQRKYENVFSENGVVQLRNQLLQRSKAKMEFNCEIIKRHVVPLDSL